MVVQVAPSAEEAAMVLFVEMENYLVEMVFCEPNISDADIPTYLRNNTSSPGTWISHNARLSTSNSANFSQQLPKRRISGHTPFIFRRCVWIHLNCANAQDPTGCDRNRPYLSLSCFFLR